MGVVALGVAALVSFVRRDEPVATSPVPSAATTAVTRRGEPDTAPERLPKLIPLPGELREEGGILWWSSVGCRAAALDVASGAVTPMAGIGEEHCKIWPSPAGDQAVAVTQKRADALGGKGLIRFGAIQPNGSDSRIVAHTPGFLASEVAWKPDSTGFAVCVGTREGVVVDVVAFRSGRDELKGDCFPAWLDDGRLAVARSDPVSIVVGSKELLGRAQAERLLPKVPEHGFRAVSALAAGGGLLVAGLVAVTETRLLPSSSALVVLAPDGPVRFSAQLRPRTLPAVVGLAPDGSGLWYLDSGDGRARAIEIPGGVRFPVYNARWISWSPSGRYLAAATAGGILLLRWPEGDRVGELPIPATSVSWTRGP